MTSHLDRARRSLLRAAAALAAGGLECPHAQSSAAPGKRAAFETRSVADTLAALGLPAAPPPGDGVELQALDLVEDGALVEIGITSRLPRTRRLLLMAERNPNTLVATFELGAGVAPALTLRIKLAESMDVIAVAVDAAGGLALAHRPVRVTEGGCGGESPALPEAVTAPAPRPSLIRARRTPEGAQLRLLMQHDMESGQRHTAQGQPIPAWHIADVEVACNGIPVLAAQWGPAVSKNPYLACLLPDARAGDRIRLRWRDNRGAERSDEAVVG